MVNDIYYLNTYIFIFTTVRHTFSFYVELEVT